MNANVIAVIGVACFQDHAALVVLPEREVAAAVAVEVEVEDPKGTATALPEADDADNGLLFVRLFGEGPPGVEDDAGVVGVAAAAGEVDVGVHVPVLVPVGEEEAGVDDGVEDAALLELLDAALLELLDAAEPPTMENSGLMLPESPIRTMI
jgi:hypothetical protein